MLTIDANFKRSTTVAQHMYCSWDNGYPVNPQPLGVAVQGFEYKKYEAGATHSIPPLRFPGQYDEESDLHENWNRFYEPLTARYLAPEPKLLEPKWVEFELEAGRQPWVYGYTRNSPVEHADPTGLYVIGARLADCPNYYAALLRARRRAGCDPSHNGDPTCHCQQRARACLNGCDLCKVLEPGSGPDLIPTRMPALLGATPSGSAVYVPFDACTDLTQAAVNELTDFMIHEAAHICEQRAFGQMSHRGPPFSSYNSPWLCDPQEIEDVCAGRPN